MTEMTPERTTRCEFSDADATLVTRIATAVVDQTIAGTDTAIDLIDAIEMPLGEAIHLLARVAPIEGVSVTNSTDGISVTLSAAQLQQVPPAELFDDSWELISAFFEVDWSGEHEIRLRGTVS
jgi:hypothetical protein